MADDAYAKLVERLARKDYAGIPADLRADILRFYSDRNAPISTKSKPSDWAKLSEDLERLRAAAPPAVSPSQD
jgi:hypothetical protein